MSRYTSAEGTEYQTVMPCSSMKRGQALGEQRDLLGDHRHGGAGLERVVDVEYRQVEVQRRVIGQVILGADRETSRRTSPRTSARCDA